MTGMFITGASGGLGSHLISCASGRGMSLTALVRTETDTTVFDQSAIAYSADWRRTLETSGAGASLVHLGAFVHHRPGRDDFEAAHWGVNHGRTVQLAADALAAGIGHFVFASTVAIYGRSVHHVDLGATTTTSRKSRLAAASWGGQGQAQFPLC